MSKRADPFAIEVTPELIIRAYAAGIFPMAETQRRRSCSSASLFASLSWTPVLASRPFESASRGGDGSRRHLTSAEADKRSY
jgi:hypothetical protein